MTSPTSTAAASTFCAPVAHGALEIRVEVLRRGASACQLRAALRSIDGVDPAARAGWSVGLEVTATFCRARAGLDVVDVEPPAVPSPRELPLYGDGGRFISAFTANFERKLALGTAWWRDGAGSGGPARRAQPLLHRGHTDAGPPD